MKTHRFILALAFLVTCLTASRAQDSYETEAARLAELMQWKAGSVVAEIGAGEGQMALDAARRVGPTGHVYATELDEKKLAALKIKAADASLHNISVIEAHVADANLPAECCDAIFMRLVYHHLTRPIDLDASLLRSLKPGGTLAVIDMPPSKGSSPVEGVPANRGGHGVPAPVVVDELAAAGFQIVSGPLDFPDGNFCVVVRKPPQ